MSLSGLTVMDARTRATLDAALAREGMAVDAALTIERRPLPDHAPLAFAQQRLWFLSRLAPSSAAYNVPLAITFRGALHVAALERMLNEVVQRHEILRTAFELQDGEPVQRIVPALTVPLPVTALDAGNAAEARVAARRAAAEEAALPFDLARAPLLRARLLRLASDEHLLLLTLHHIVTDAWSMQVLAREMRELYAAFAAGRRPGLAPLTIQYADFAAWQRGSAYTLRLQSQLAYWRKQLAGATVLELPTDRPRPALATTRGAARRFAFEPALARDLRTLAQSESVTLFMLLLALFTVLLHRYSGQDDIVVGSPIAGRMHPELEPLIGFFINSLVLRNDLSGNPPFRELLQHVRATAIGAYAHQELPFEKLVEELQPGRDLSRNPLFQVMFQLLRASEGSDDAAEADGFESDELAAKFDLSVTLQDHPGGALQAFVEYNADLYERDSIDALCTHYVNLARAFVAAPDTRIGAATMLGTDEERHLRLACNDTAADFPAADGLHLLIEHAAAAHPHAIAVDDGRERMTHAELQAAANRLARRLCALGVGPQRLVGIYLSRSTDMVVSILATLKAGGGYLPLDPDYPLQRLAYMAQDAAVTVLITHSALPPLPLPSGIAVLELDRSRATLSRESDTPFNRQTAPEDPAYVIYTSGSTGRPKGVVVPQRAVCNHMQWMVSRFAFGPRDAVLQKTPIGFDASVWEIFAPLMVGARLVLARQGAHRDAACLVRSVSEHAVSVLQLVPSQLRLVLDEPGLAQCSTLRLLFSGGEPLNADLCVRWCRQHGAELVNLYGPTEATIDAVYACCRSIGPGDTVPIGKPIANLSAHVLDRYGNLVPRSVPGVLHLGGDGLALGYLGQPSLTAERFVPDRFSDRPGAKLYNTGDRVRRRRDGTLEYLGRVDHQVKLRGYRIEPAEVAGALESHPLVRQAVAALRSGADGQPGLVAYVVSTKEPPPALNALRSHLHAVLPDYMMPAAIVLLPELPRTPHGKIDWLALPAPVAESAPARAAALAPVQPMQQRMAALWASVLGAAEVGADDNFFDLGGHSLLMVQLQHRLRTEFGADVPLLDLFRHPTVRTLEAHLAARQAPAASAAPAVESAAAAATSASAASVAAPRRPSMQSRPIFRRPAS